MYRVVKCPGGLGAVYSVTPVDQDGPVKQIHRSEMRAVGAGASPETVARMSDSETEELQECESESENEMLCVVLEDHNEYDSDLEDDDINDSPFSSRTSGSSLSSPGLEQPSFTIERGEPYYRRTNRTTAGQHTNPHHLPQSALREQAEQTG